MRLFVIRPVRLRYGAVVVTRLRVTGSARILMLGVILSMLLWSAMILLSRLFMIVWGSELLKARLLTLRSGRMRRGLLATLIRLRIILIVWVICMAVTRIIRLVAMGSLLGLLRFLLFLLPCVRLLVGWVRLSRFFVAWLIVRVSVLTIRGRGLLVL